MSTSVIRRVAGSATCAAFAACGGALEPDFADLPEIVDLGITISAYDSASNTAGDITFEAGETFIPFGKLLEGADGNLKRTPELTWYVQEGTAVRAPITGTVSQIDVLYSNDYLIVLRHPSTGWEVGVEHVDNPLVQVGDDVTAGQTIATATAEQSPNGARYGFTELAVWWPADTDEEMIKLCPYVAFSDALKQDFTDQIYALAEAWESYWGQDVFDEQSWTLPGCVIEQMTEAEGRNPTG